MLQQRRIRPISKPISTLIEGTGSAVISSLWNLVVMHSRRKVYDYWSPVVLVKNFHFCLCSRNNIDTLPIMRHKSSLVLLRYRRSTYCLMRSSNVHTAAHILFITEKTNAVFCEKNQSLGECAIFLFVTQNVKNQSFPKSPIFRPERKFWIQDKNHRFHRDMFSFEIKCFCWDFTE